MAEEIKTKVEETENEETTPAAAEQDPPKEKKKLKLRQKLGKWLQEDKLELPKKVKTAGKIVAGAALAGGAAVGAVLLKQHLGDDGAEVEAPTGLLPEGESPFEVNDYVIEDVNQA